MSKLKEEKLWVESELLPCIKEVKMWKVEVMGLEVKEREEVEGDSKQLKCTLQLQVELAVAQCELSMSSLEESHRLRRDVMMQVSLKHARGLETSTRQRLVEMEKERKEFNSHARALQKENIKLKRDNFLLGK